MELKRPFTANSLPWLPLALNSNAFQKKFLKIGLVEAEIRQTLQRSGNPPIQYARASVKKRMWSEIRISDSFAKNLHFLTKIPKICKIRSFLKFYEVGEHGGGFNGWFHGVSLTHPELEMMSFFMDNSFLFRL